MLSRMIIIATTVLVVALTQSGNAEANCNGLVGGLSENYNPSTGSGFLAVRSGATTQAKQIGELFNGANITVIGREGKWLKIIGPNGEQGWVYSKYVDVNCSELTVNTSRPSFDCNKASLPDEIIICQIPQLAELDLIVAAGYKFLKATKGKAFADDLGQPLLRLRMACGGDQQCIAGRQIEAIQAYNMAGAPVSLPSWVTEEDDARVTEANTAAVEANTQAVQSADQSLQENTAATQQVASAVTSAAQLSAEKADEMNKRIADLSAQIATLSKVLEEQKKQQEATTDADEKPAIDQTIVAINVRIEALQKEYAEVDTVFSQYLTSIKPNDRDLYLTARKASQLYPKVPYYIPGTKETGEFWVEPKVTDAGELMFNFRLIDPAAENDTTRSLINMNLSQLEESQKALFKLFKNSVIAHEKKIRENYTKRVVCFPVEQCPEERQKGEKGKTSTEVVFMIYEDGSTGGRLQQNKGAFQEGVNFSIDSALLLQAYLSHVIKEAKLEFESGTRTQQQLDDMFQ